MLPVITLSAALPVALILPDPVRRQVFDIGAERIGDRCLNRVGSLARGFRDHVAGVVDNVGIVSQPADQGVRAGAAIERCRYLRSW